MPTWLPRRHLMRALRPAAFSDSNKTNDLPISPSITSRAPVGERSMTRHGRVAKLPSNRIQAGEPRVLRPAFRRSVRFLANMPASRREQRDAHSNVAESYEWVKGGGAEPPDTVSRA